MVLPKLVARMTINMSIDMFLRMTISELVPQGARPASAED